VRLYKQIVLGIIGLSFVLFVFGSITYAWVSMAQINNIDNIQMSASAGDELQISLDGVNYHTALPGDDLTHNMRLKDVTSRDGITFTRGAFSEYGTALAGSDYISFNLYFRTERPESGLYLVNKPTDEDILENASRGTYVTSAGITFMPQVHYTEENNELILAHQIKTYYAKDALRLSLSELDENNQVIKTLIYDPSENEARGYGKYYGAYSYFIAKTDSHLELPTMIPPTTYRLSQMDPNNPYQALDNTSLVAIMKRNIFQQDDDPFTYATVRINLWIEGWDADAIDGIIQDILQVQLEFKIAHPA
jgi:hypothetical protein